MKRRMEFGPYTFTVAVERHFGGEDIDSVALACLDGVPIWRGGGWKEFFDLRGTYEERWREMLAAVREHAAAHGIPFSLKSGRRLLRLAMDKYPKANSGTWPKK